MQYNQGRQARGKGHFLIPIASGKVYTCAYYTRCKGYCFEFMLRMKRFKKEKRILIPGLSTWETRPLLWPYA